jgi:hypothetical protein
LNWSIVDAMFTVKELMLSPAGTVAEPLDAGVELDALAEVDVDGVLEDDELLDDEHPAAAKETSAAVSPTQPRPRTPRDLRLPCEWEDRPPSVLKPSPIPNIPSLVTRPDGSMRGHHTAPVSRRGGSTRRSPDLGDHRAPASLRSRAR